MCEAKTILRTALGVVPGNNDDFDLWTLNYKRALSIVWQQWPPSGILPILLYLIRWGQRRRAGRFSAVYSDGNTDPEVQRVAKQLIDRDNGTFVGFDDDLSEEILRDALLALCVETKGEKQRNKEVHRLLPTHFLSSWVDLPRNRSQMRDVPELLASMLQSRGADPALFQAGLPPSENRLLRPFSSGVRTDLTRFGKKQDSFVDSAELTGKLGLDQLLTIRIAQGCEYPPDGENDRGPVREPLAARAAAIFREDVAAIIDGYGESAPRQVLVPILESAFSLALTNQVSSLAGILRHWEVEGRVPDYKDQVPTPCFVDCSSGSDRELRRIAEESFAEMLRRLERIPIHFAALRLLTAFTLKQGQLTPDQKKLADLPDSTEWLRLLGEIAHDRHTLSEDVLRAFGDFGSSVKQSLDAADCSPAARALLNDLWHLDKKQRVWQLAEAYERILEDHGTSPRGGLLKVLRGCLLIDEPNGWAKSRRAQDNYRKTEKRALVFTNTALDFLVHRYVWTPQGRRSISVHRFLQLVRDNYGFYIAESPPGTAIAQKMLDRNYKVLQERLRDLGVLRGVDDAESMKLLRPRLG